MSTPTLQIALPTLDRPFGIELWPLFSKAYSAVAGFPPEKFVFVPQVTPLSTIQSCAAMLITYYVTIFAGRELMKSREPFNLNGLFMVHNLYLTVISGVLLALFIEQLLPTVVRNGVFYAICDYRGGWTAPLVTLYYVGPLSASPSIPSANFPRRFSCRTNSVKQLNYLTKYLELLDTIFMVLKKKPLTFLHTYHHGATALLCYTQLIGLTSVSWVPITLNLLVHVVMYWYYFQAARGVKIWWKQYITRLQILQFVIDLGFVYFASYTYFTSTYFSWLPNAGRCAGEEFAAFAGMGILSSYLLLFISFYFATYRKETSTKGSRGGKKQHRRRMSETATTAVRDMAHAEVPDASEVKDAGRAVGEKMHVIEHQAGNGSANGSLNGGVTPRVTRSRKS